MNLSDQNKFIQIKLNHLKKRKYESLLELSCKDLKKENGMIKFLFKNLNKEKQDVEDLQKLSFVSLYHSIMGDKHQQFNIEQQEYFAAKLKFDGCQSSITSLKMNIEYYQNEIKSLDSLEKQSILEINTSQQLTQEESQELKSIEKHTGLRLMKIEVQDAIKIGVMVKADLSEALKLMYSATSWGIGDMLGGGLIVTSVKHNKINRSKKVIEKIQISLSKFHRELQDIDTFKSSEFKININSFDTFADYFLDGIIFDWFVQSKINQSKEMLQEASIKTQALVTSLYRELDTINEELDSLIIN